MAHMRARPRFMRRAVEKWAIVRAMKKLIVIAGLSLGVSGCLQPPPPTPLETSWNRYQTCVHQTRNANVACARLKLAYEAELNRAPK